MNDHGQVVGWAATKDDVTHGILWEDGISIDLGTMGGSDSLASGISASGDIVGVMLREGKRRLWLWRNAQVVDLGLVDELPTRLGPGNFNTDIRINGMGQVTGWAISNGGHAHSFLYFQDRMVYIGSPGLGIGGYVQGINNRGQMVGQTSRTNGCSHAFLWQEGQMIDLGALGGSWASATAINESGMVIGWAFVPGGSPRNAHAFVWEHAQMRDLGTLGGKTSRAYGLNSLGQVVGYAETASGDTSAFIWRNGRMMDLNGSLASNSGWRVTCGDAINDRGQSLIRMPRHSISAFIVSSPNLSATRFQMPYDPAPPSFCRQDAPS